MQTNTNPAPTTTNTDIVLSFNRSQLLALKTFLERAEIKGYEVSRFLEVARIITDAEQRPGYAVPIVPLTPEAKAAKS